MQNAHIGQTVYLRGGRVFDAMKNGFLDQPRIGPLHVERIYRSGDHVRVKASLPGEIYGYHDACIDAFDSA